MDGGRHSQTAMAGRKAAWPIYSTVNFSLEFYRALIHGGMHAFNVQVAQLGHQSFKVALGMFVDDSTKKNVLCRISY